jgi:four helix bundle protein
MGIFQEEADETSFWIELLIDVDLIKRERVGDLLQEADELPSIVVSSIKTARFDGAKSVSKSAIRTPQSEIE